MECKQVTTIIREWEASGTMMETSLPALEKHMVQCKAGCRQYLPLLPFLKKDAGKTAIILREKSFASRADRIMAVIAGPTRRQSGLPRWLPAAAILIILGAGIFLTSRIINRTKDELLVQFELKTSEAQSVYLVGDFSQWNPLGIPLKGPDHEGVWKVKIRLKRNKSYTYNFLINGEIWIPDPTAEFTVDDGFGGINSVINL